MAIKTWTSGEVLTATDLNTYAGNPGLVYVGQNVFSSSNLVTLDGIFTSTFSHYRVLVQITNSTANCSVLLRMRSGGSTNANSQYTWGGFISFSGSSILAATTSGGTATSWVVTELDTAFFPNTPFAVEMMSPQASQRTTVFASGFTPVNPQPYYRHLGGSMSVTTSYDGMALVPSAGNISGTVTVYGYRVG
jgi:hypothetical protein